ncbi:exosome complex component RRP40 [Nematocida sp. AWRm78]|nr:exosome complex component RRP40 [Nematocida sp. AWRm79]KAI5183684.1 exosome complex component RRP40 [Nematocida sp. AWRm78]
MFLLPGEKILKHDIINTSLGIKTEEITRHSTHSTESNEQCIKSNVHSTLNNTLNSAHSTVNNAHSTVNSTHSTINNAHSTRHNTHSTLSNSVHVSCAVGELLSLGMGKYWVNYKQFRYLPLLDDIVLGVVKGKGKDTYKVDIGGPSYAIINYLDFPSATKRNRVTLSVGDVLLGQVVEDSLHCESVISCRTESIPGMGVLKNGVLLKVGILQSRKYLLHPPDMGSSMCIFSMNGYVWVSPPTQENIKEVLSLI